MQAGESLASRAGKNLKRSTLELGGSDAFLVLEDCDLEFAVKMAVLGRIGNVRQTCIGAKRFIVVGPRAEQFLNAFRDALAQLTPGDPLDESTTLGRVSRLRNRNSQKLACAILRIPAWAGPAARPRSRRYNEGFMSSLLYAAIAYVRSPVGIFVEQLRRELHPAHTHADAHLTVLPPRPLCGTEQQAIELLTEVCHATSPFEITMGDVETFAPITPTVFLRVARGAYRMRELRDRLNLGALCFQEPWPYMPHLTIVKADSDDEAARALEIARQRWSEYSDTRKVRISKLSFVKGTGERWVDLAAVQLGKKTGR